MNSREEASWMNYLIDDYIQKIVKVFCAKSSKTCCLSVKYTVSRFFLGFQKAMGLGNNFILALINNVLLILALKGENLGLRRKTTTAEGRWIGFSSY